MNKLEKEKSLYLQQHANNPVDWLPWGDEAFEISRSSNKPILLSIGYSACHWCHVMAHESFEDEDIAEIMNKNFVNIKLDREERPDLDKIYQTAQTIITGKTGGWPLTVFMTPEKMPFFAGTYFPPEERYGLPSFRDILERVSEFYEQKKNDIEMQNIKLNDIFNNLNKISDDKVNIDKALIEKTSLDITGSIDRVHGGLSGAPKFPHINNFLFLLTCGTSESNDLVKLTLDRMSNSGIYDHLDGGFFRYSVDELWMIPHFEKMLYDNGPFISLYAKAYMCYQKNSYLNTVKETSDWAITRMQDENGGFYSTIDADSEGEEGKFYVWTLEEINQYLDEDLVKVFLEVFALDNKTNFEGKYHLHVSKKNEDKLIQYKDEIKKIKNILLSQRNKRIAPNTDRKILLSWNSLMIIGLIDAYKITNEDKYLKSAEKCLFFIKENMRNGDKLLACFHDSPSIDGYLDDYSFFCLACLEYLKIKWDKQIIELVLQTADKALELFLDRDNGGFFFSSSENLDLIFKPKILSDESVPSGSSIFINVLSQLYELTGNEKYIAEVDKSINGYAASIKNTAFSHCSLLTSIHSKGIDKRFIVVKCANNYRDRVIATFSRKMYINDNIYILDKEQVTNLEFLDNKKCYGDFTAYVCVGMTCSEPIKNIDIIEQ
tara:strand:- start:318 stop:2300 length:1983 start_codon:yes stop_codon:yes gene_type:complete